MRIATGLRWSLGLIPLLMLLPAQAAPPPGRLLASQCAQCHGTDGRSRTEIDGLGGEEAGEIQEELGEMQMEFDPAEIMHLQANGYSDEQIRLISEYFATLPAVDD